MKTLSKYVRAFVKQDDGAAMIEYSLLIGVITVAAVTAVVFAGEWAGAQWDALQGTLETTDTQPAAE